MLPSLTRTITCGYRFCAPRTLLVALSLFLLAPLSLIHAQGVGSSRGDAIGAGGGSSIQGHLYFNGERPTDTHIKITLDSTNSGTRITITDSDGTFNFSGLGAGPYTITVEGTSEYEMAVERVEIYREARSPIYFVPIYLKPKPGAALAGVPKAAADLYTKALEAARGGDGKKAIELLSSAIIIHPNFALALNELGVQYLKSAQPDKAVEVLRSAVKLTPDAFTPRLNYGIALLNKKKFVEAEEELRLALQKNDASHSAHLYLGIALISQHKLDDAEKELLRAASPGRDDLGLAHYYLGGIYWSKHEYKRAADELEKYLKLVPNAPDAERTRAVIKDLRNK